MKDKNDNVRPPGNSQHLQRLLTTWSDNDQLNVSAGRLKHLVGTTLIAEMLNDLCDERGDQLFGLKGGSALQLRFGFRARATSDLDATFRGELFEGMELVRAALTQGTQGFTGTITSFEELSHLGIRPAPLRFRIKLFYKKQNFVSIPFEMSGAEATSMDTPERLAAHISLKPVQLQDAEGLSFLPLRFQIAQKLHACTEDLSHTERSNDRARDLFDILLIRDLAVNNSDWSYIREACVEIFEVRNKQTWPPTIVAWDDWAEVWNVIQEKEATELTLDEALQQVQSFVYDIDNS